MIHAAICDDEAFFVTELAKRTQNYFAQHSIEATVFSFTDPLEFLSNDLAVYDLVFLDVAMDGKNGIEVAKELRKVNSGAVLIFLSAYVDYAIMGYYVRAFTYLLKSELRGTFDTTMEEAMRELRHSTSTLEIPLQGERVRIPLAQIVFLESQRHQILLHGVSEQTFTCFPGKISTLETQLDKEGFP